MGLCLTMCELQEETKSRHNTAKRADHTTTAADGSLWTDRETLSIGPLGSCSVFQGTEGPGQGFESWVQRFSQAVAALSIGKLRITDSQGFV